MSYVELNAQSNFSFLEGASHPEELVEQAVSLGLKGLALTDRDGVYGVVRAHQRLKELQQEGRVHKEDFQLIVGSTLQIDSMPPLVLLAQDREGYAQLSSLISRGRLRCPKGESKLYLKDLEDLNQGMIALWPNPDEAKLDELHQIYKDRLFLAVSRHLKPRQEQRLQAIKELGRKHRIQLVATNQVLYHHPSRKALQDILTCIREGCTIQEAGLRLQANASRHVRAPHQMHRLFHDLPGVLERSLEIANTCSFSLDMLQYRYPSELLPQGITAMEHLRELIIEGCRWRYPEGCQQSILDQIEHELRLIEKMDFPHYFLTVHDLVRFARQEGILCQGRGSAANSAVCFVLGITNVDPAYSHLLFERFISEERGEPPDIDVDFEHERREEVIQYLYEKYGRNRAAMASTYVCYRGRSAAREVGKALGFTLEQVDALSKSILRGHAHEITPERFSEVGLDPTRPEIRMYGALTHQLLRFPRHLSIHTGGFVLSDEDLTRIVPIENASMERRTVIQWDKEDLESLGLLKVDVLGLGILSCIKKSFEMIRKHCGKELSLATIPAEDPQVYDMICQADTIGVFQIESRAQMSMLPRLKPRTFYDLVVEVALIRPGPIQGKMVHPYLRRRQGLESVNYPHPALESILARTYGVPLFQEQVMQLAVAVANFTPGEADELRRAMGSWRRTGRMNELGQRLISGMLQNGLSEQFAAQVFEQIKGFAEYGFPESHATSFAHLVYASAYIKYYWPEVFTSCLLNSQPMGFYPNRTLVADAQRHGVDIRPIDIQKSDWDCTLEPYKNGQGERKHALRLGLRLIKNLGKRQALEIEQARNLDGPFLSISNLQKRTGLERRTIEAIASSDAFHSLGRHRRASVWDARGLPAQADLLLDGAVEADASPPLPGASELDEVIADFQSLGLSIRKHPLDFIRKALKARGALMAQDLLEYPTNRKISVAGIVVARQMPATASGVLFMSLEDESGMSNIVIWPSLLERYRDPILTSAVLLVHGKLERAGLIANVIAEHIERIDITERDFNPGSRSFC